MIGRQNFNNVKKIIKNSTIRLTLSYLAIIMLMSFGSSLIFYRISYDAIGRQLMQVETIGTQTRGLGLSDLITINEFLQERIAEVRHELSMRLIFINLLILLVGSVISYLLARKTLQPIAKNIEAQEQFISDASHELRTPLTAIQTTNEVALRKNNITSPEAKDILKNNIEEVAKLKQLVDSLLHLAKADGNAYNFTKLDLSDVVSEALNKVATTAIAKNIAINDAVPKISITGNKESLSQAIAIILDNAIKYSPDNSHVNISAKKTSKLVTIKIKDQGIGIKKIHLPHIFERFYRADSSRSKSLIDGFGIGLALAKKIVEQHDGKVIVTSTPGKGSTFSLTIPSN